MYNVICQTFITPDRLTHANILYRLNLPVNILSIRLRTAPAGRLKVLTLPEGI